MRLKSNHGATTHLLVGFLLGGFIPTCYTQTGVEIAKLEKKMSVTKFTDESYPKKICICVKQQLLTSNVIVAKAIQLKIPHKTVADLLDNFIDEWIKNLKKDSQEFKSLTGWILYDSIKRQFLNL